MRRMRDDRPRDGAVAMLGRQCCGVLPLYIQRREMGIPIALQPNKV